MNRGLIIALALAYGFAAWVFAGVCQECGVMTYTNLEINIDGYSAFENNILRTVAGYWQKPLLGIPSKQIETELEQNSQINSVQVTRKFPHTLQISVILKEPVAFITPKKEKKDSITDTPDAVIAIDSSGQPFKYVNPLSEDVRIFNVVTSEGDSDFLNPGSELTGIYRAILALMSEAPNLARKFRTLESGSGGEVRMWDEGGQHVVLFHQRTLRNALQRAEIFLTQGTREKSAEFDFRFPDYLVIRPQQEGYIHG